MSTKSKIKCLTSKNLLSSSSDSISSLCTAYKKSKSYDSLNDIEQDNKEDFKIEIRNNLNNKINVRRRQKNPTLIKLSSSPTIKDAIKIVTRINLSPSWGIDNDYVLNYE